MSEFYRPHRQRNRYDPTGTDPFRVSRAKVELFIGCRRCCYLDLRLGTARPPMMPFNLNSAVDALLKREFDAHRAAGTAHPLMRRYGIDAVPFRHPSMDEWREALRGGVRFVHPGTQFLLTGAPDDLWVTPRGTLHVVDYKSTSKDGQPTLDAPWQGSYKRQVEFYRWLLERNGFDVEPTAYFVYANGRRDREAFDATLEFDVIVIPYAGDTAWVEPTLREMKACLDQDELPLPGDDCDWCAYRAATARHELW